ncbi:MAG: Bug family tripartite tricarboxylate transporter substrate binding protein [Pseudomonadota bacterium]|jgi:tripartite-type tricarboxylate transporter receptor subunit TctC
MSVRHAKRIHATSFAAGGREIPGALAGASPGAPKGRAGLGRVALVAGAAALAFAAPGPLATTAHAQAWPAKTVRFVLGFPPGGGSDILGRIVAARMQEFLGQPVVIENRPGASGNIAAEFVARAPADGYTIYLAQIVAVSISPSLFAKLPYDPVRDFAPVSLIATGPNLLVVHPALPVKSVKDLVALARSRPGEMNFASVGPGSIQHLAGEQFNLAAGVKTVHVPYKGSSPAGIDLMAGQVSFMFDSAPPVMNFVKSGRMRLLAVTSARRSALMPDVPTLAESGLPGFDFSTWWGLMAPAATPRPIIDRLNAELGRTLKLPEVRERFEAVGAEPRHTTPEEFAAVIRAEIPRFAKLVKAAGVRIDQ